MFFLMSPSPFNNFKRGVVGVKRNERTGGRKMVGRREMLGRKDDKTEGRKDGRAERRKGGRTEGRKNGRTEERKNEKGIFLPSYHLPNLLLSFLS